MFQVTTLDLENPPKKKDGGIDYTQDFFGKLTSLTVSGQLEGELGAMALGEVYTFGPYFPCREQQYTKASCRILDD